MFGPGTVAWLVKKWFSAEERETPVLPLLLEILAFSVAIMEITVFALRPFGKVIVTTAVNGGPVVNYGTTAMILSLFLAVIGGSLGAKVQGGGLNRCGKVLLVMTILTALAGCIAFLCLHMSRPKETYEITTKPLKINDEYYNASVPIYVNENGEYFIQAHVLAERLGLTFETEKSGMFQLNCKFDGNEFAVDTLKGGADYFMKDKEVYVSFSMLENLFGLNVRNSAVLPDGSDRRVIYIDNYPQRFHYEWTKNPYVAHALGGLDGDVTYTNSIEAFEKNYNAGHRVFEVDLRLTADGGLVASHDAPKNEAGELMTQEEFSASKVQGQYTPLTFEDVVRLMVKYPDVYMITDTKKKVEDPIREQFSLIVDIANSIAPEVLDRIIPQIYNEEMYDIIMGMYDWKSIVYTMYALDEFSEKEVISFAYREGIKVITTSGSKSQQLFFDELYERDIQVYMHTFNTIAEVDELRARGVWGFYTDFLVPEAT